LVARDRNGQVETVRYTAVNTMLLNEFLKEHKAFIEEQHKIEKLQSTVAQQQKQIEALTAGLQKVSAQLEVSRSAPEMVFNNH
jgi:predicted polyphosphate/ATP-dependent NAD kinase